MGNGDLLPDLPAAEDLADLTDLDPETIRAELARLRRFEILEGRPRGGGVERFSLQRMAAFRSGAP